MSDASRTGRVAVTIDEYLAGVPEPQRSTLVRVRSSIRSIVPDADECISYGMPAYRLGGKVIAGFAAFTAHCAYLPHSGSVFGELSDALSGYTYSSGSLHFAVDRPLPKTLLRKLIAVRRRQAGV